MTDRRSKMTLAWLIAVAALAALAQGAAVVALLPLLSALAVGDDAARRTAAVEHHNQTGQLDLESNIQFGYDALQLQFFVLHHLRAQ